MLRGPRSARGWFHRRAEVLSRAAGRQSLLPDYFERELNVPGWRHRRLQTSATTKRSVRIENLGLSRDIKREGRREVGVIQEIEKLRPELHSEGFRNLLHRKVLIQGEIQVNQWRTANAVAAGVAQ